jgi:hypothetical protein
MTLIDSIDFEVAFQLYRVTLYRGGRADVFAIKRSRSGSHYLSTIKTGSGTYKRVMRELRKQAMRGSLLAEQIAEHEASE